MPLKLNCDSCTEETDDTNVEVFCKVCMNELQDDRIKAEDENKRFKAIIDDLQKALKVVKKERDKWYAEFLELSANVR